MNDGLATAVAGLLVLGLGDPNRGDDSLGPEVVAALRLELPIAVRNSVIHCLLSSLMDHWQGAENVVLVDAVCSGGEPGNIVRFDLTQQDFPQGFQAVSAHAVSVVETLALAKVLGRMPVRLGFIGAEGQQFEVGHPMSALMVDAKEKIVAELLAEMAINHSD